MRPGEIEELHFLSERKARAPLPAAAYVAHGIRVVVTENHRNWTAGRVCHGAACSPSVTCGRFWIGTSTSSTSHNVIWMESPIASGACSAHLRCSLVELTRDVNPPTCKNRSGVSSLELCGLDVSGPSDPTAFTIALSTQRSDAPATHIGTSLMLILKAIIS
jgi:hypothetical protein